MARHDSGLQPRARMGRLPLAKGPGRIATRRGMGEAPPGWRGPGRGLEPAPRVENPASAAVLDCSDSKLEHGRERRRAAPALVSGTVRTANQDEALPYSAASAWTSASRV